MAKTDDILDAASLLTGLKPATDEEIAAAASKGEIGYYEGMKVIEHPDVKRSIDSLYREFFSKPSLLMRMLRDKPTDTRPADLRAATNTPWASGGGDGEYLCMCVRCSVTFSHRSKRAVVCAVCEAKAARTADPLGSKRTEAEIAELRAAGTQPLRINTIPPIGPTIVTGERLTMDKVREAVDMMRDMKAMADQACGMPKAERFVFVDFNSALVDTVTGKRYVLEDRYKRLAKRIDDMQGETAAIRAHAEALLGPAVDDRPLVEQLCDLVERLRDGDAVAALDAENARLRGELAAARIERDTWQADAQRYAGNADYWRERAEGEPAAGNVTRIEPFPDLDPRSDSWPPPSHKPRMLP